MKAPPWISDPVGGPETAGGVAYSRSVILTAVIESPDGIERRTLEVAAASFEQGKDELDALMPDGWKRRSIVVG